MRLRLLPRLIATLVMASSAILAAQPENSPPPEATQRARGRGAAMTAAPPAACRTGVETYRIVTTSPVFTSTTEGRCTFDREKVEGTCTNEYRDGQGRRFTSVSVTRHASIADVVGEVSVVPPLMRALETATTVSGGGADTTGVNTLSYDAEGRLQSMTAVSRPSGQRSVTTYTAWDRAGRPMAGLTEAGRVSTPMTLSYDDSTRTLSTTTAGQTCTQNFDANGNPTVARCAGSTSTTTVLTTQRICP
jgi:hypothetical protein